MRVARSVFLVGMASIALLIVTEPGMSIVWDEGYTLGRIQRVRFWFQAVADPQEFARNWSPPQLELVQQQGFPAPSANQVATRWNLLFNPRVVGWFWPFAREEPHGHPPFYALVGLLGDGLTPWREPLGRARLGTILFHGLACSFIFYSLNKRMGLFPALVACSAWSFSPHVFALAHYATYDGLLNSLWVMGLLASAEALQATHLRTARKFDVLAGLILGAAMATKLSGWFLVFPLALSILLSGFAWQRIKGFALSLFLAMLSVYLWNPSWWCEPVSGPIRFFRSNLNRAQTIPIETLYMGRVYKTPAESLPWSNTLVLSLMATPVFVLVCIVVGLAEVARKSPNRSFGLIIASGWLIPMALRAMPHTPGHDGTRQLITALGTSCLIAGMGLSRIFQCKPILGKLLGVCSITELCLSVAIFQPVPLSYFSPLVGSLPGANRLGMESTYYWDGLTEPVLNWINENSTSGDKIAFVGTPSSFVYLNQTGQLKPSVDPRSPGRFRWLVVQNRPGNFQKRDWAIVRALKPAYTYSKLGVWLVAVYDMDEVQQLWATTPELQR